VSDYVLLVRSVPVEHLMPGGRLEPHRPTDTATPREGALFYPARSGQQALPGGVSPRSES
jgi:hypothetical protein